MSSISFLLTNIHHYLDTITFNDLLVQLFIGWIFFCWSILSMTIIFGPPIIYFRYTCNHSPKKARSSTVGQTPKSTSQPPVSILRPLKGLDCNIEQNLECVFLQQYPHFEIIFCVSDPEDPVVPVVRSVQAKYPHIDSSLLIGEEAVGVNPKVNNLMKGYNSAKYDILWVIDSNVYVDEGSLSEAIELMSEPGVGLVQQMPCGIQYSSLGSLLDAIYLNCTHARMYSFVNYFSLGSFVIGKSNMYRKSDLIKLGGLERFGQYMAEDNIIGTELLKLGLKHRSSSHPAYQSLGSSTLASYFGRRARWARVRKYSFLVPTIMEPFSECLVSGILISWAAGRVFGTPFWIFFTLHCLSVFTGDITSALIIRHRQIHPRRSLPRFLFLFVLGWILREISALPVYLWAVSGSTVVWRHRKFQLQWNASAVLIATARTTKETFFLHKENQTDVDLQQSYYHEPSKLEVTMNLSSFSPLSRRRGSHTQTPDSDLPKQRRYVATSVKSSSQNERLTRSVAAKLGIQVPDISPKNISHTGHTGFSRSRSLQQTSRLNMPRRSSQNEVHSTAQVI